MERLTATVILVLGTVVMLATVVSVASGAWETSVPRLVVLLVVAVGMWRAAGHLRQPSPQR